MWIEVYLFSKIDMYFFFKGLDHMSMYKFDFSLYSTILPFPFSF